MIRCLILLLGVPVAVGGHEHVGELVPVGLVLDSPHEGLEAGHVDLVIENSHEPLKVA